MKFGVLFMPADPPAGANIGERWREVLEAGEVAEEYGFDGFFLPEHHFQASSFNSSPLVALAVLAGRTKRLRVGTSVLLLPCYHPLKLAEDTAQLDLLSNGRLILGVGLGSMPEESAPFGVPPGERVSRFEETLAILRQAWTGGEIDFTGKHFSFSNLRVTPVPLQKPHPPIWMGGMSDAGVRRAGRMGLPWLTSLMPGLDSLLRWRAMYREECARGGHQPKIVVMRDAWVGESAAEVEREWWSVARKEHGRFASQAPEWMKQLDPAVVHKDSLPFAEYRRDRLIAGTPDEVIPVLQKFAAVLPTEYVVLRFRLVGGPSHEATLGAMRLFGREVIPALR
jgi:probable F420-dependent oxidoreductase